MVKGIYLSRMDSLYKEPVMGSFDVFFDEQTVE